MSIDWTKVRDLGDVPDRVIAERLGCARSTVARRRREAGVEPYADPDALVLDAEAMLAALADKKRRRAIGPRNVGELADACGWPRASMAHYTRRERRVGIPPDRARAIVDALLAGEGARASTRLALLLGL